MGVLPRAQAPPLLSPDSFPLPLTAPFTTRTAATVGIGPNALTRLHRAGLIRRVCRSVYVAAQVADTLELRAAALALVVPSTAVVTDETACWLFGVDVLPPGSHADLPPLSFFQPPGQTRIRRPQCRGGERTFLPEDITTVGPLQVATLLRTAWDLGRLRHRDRALAALDATLATGRFSRAELLAGVERFARQRGVVQLRALAPLADPRAQSPAESAMRLRWLDTPGLPPPTPQTPVLDDHGNEVFHLDLGVPELRFGAEYDGERWHDTEQQEYDERRRAWIKRQGWTLRVLRRHNVFGARQDADLILRDGIAEARRNLSRGGRK